MPPRLRRSLVGVGIMAMPGNATVILNDATATHDDVAGALGERAVTNITPPFALPLETAGICRSSPRHDVTKKRQPAQVLSILRGLLYDIPQRRVGLITHKHLAERLPALLTEAERRAAGQGCLLPRDREPRVEHVDRGVRLPDRPGDATRVPTEMIRTHLLRVGEQGGHDNRRRGPVGVLRVVREHGTRTSDRPDSGSTPTTTGIRRICRSCVPNSNRRPGGVVAYCPRGISAFVVSTEDAGYPLAPITCTGH